MKISCRDFRCKVSWLKIHELERRAHMAVFVSCLIFIASFLSEKVYTLRRRSILLERSGEKKLSISGGPGGLLSHELKSLGLTCDQAFLFRLCRGEEA